jgi:hypothetical protein
MIRKQRGYLSRPPLVVLRICSDFDWPYPSIALLIRGLGKLTKEDVDIGIDL